MKVVILAAGSGSRLADSKTPKALTKLANGKTILQHQLENIAHYTTLNSVFVVVGYQKEKVMETFPDLAYVCNARFAEENTGKSLLRALNKIDEDVLWINGDVVFRKEILEAVFAYRKTCLVVNTGPVGEEEMKYRADGQGKILEVSKEVIYPQGEAVGINFFKRRHLDGLVYNLQMCEDHDYYEKGIEQSITQGMRIWSINISPQDCIDVDFPEDLEKANQLLTQWGKTKQEAKV